MISQCNIAVKEPDPKSPMAGKVTLALIAEKFSGNEVEKSSINARYSLQSGVIPETKVI